MKSCPGVDPMNQIVPCEVARHVYKRPTFSKPQTLFRAKPLHSTRDVPPRELRYSPARHSLKIRYDGRG